MLYEQCCVLCLENITPIESRINLNMEDAISIEAHKRIDKHFKEELLIMSSLSTKFVCNKCWELLDSFHEFYIRVQNAHLEASYKLEALQESTIAVTEIKVETNDVDELATTSNERKECAENNGSVELYTSKEEIIVGEFHIKSEAICDESNHSNCVPLNSLVEDDSSNSMSEAFRSSVSTNNVDKAEHNSLEKKKSKFKKRRMNTTNVHSERNKTSHYDDFIAKNFKLTCFLCEKSLIDFKELKVHYREQHQTNGYAKCCGKKLYNRGILVDHIHVHNNPDYFKCQHCDKVLCDRSSLESHLQHFHDSNERIVYKCDICSKGFFRRKVLARHYLIHAPEEQKTVKCTQCEKTFCNQYSMKQHLNLTHLNLYAKICDICGKSLKNKEALQRHQEEHAGVQRSSVQCKLCNVELKTKYGLTRHMKTMHTKEYQTPQVCPVCSKVSPTLRAHKSHMEYMHSGKKHICNICDKSFKLPNCLREHMTTHTGEVLYTCTFCPQTFNSKSNMYAHRKRKHPKEWTQKCSKKNQVDTMVKYADEIEHVSINTTLKNQTEKSPANFLNTRQDIADTT
uniref:Transcription factor grauzone n=1 Tax=Ceratitis capitata TaxID=7213 RepID=W8AJU8_CERCA